MADAVDARAAAGEDTGPLCGLPLSVKDSQVCGAASSARDVSVSQLTSMPGCRTLRGYPRLRARLPS